MPLARQLRALDLYGSRLDANLLATFGQSDAASGLETLVLQDTGMDVDVATTMIYTQVMNRPGMAVQSPLDRL